MLQGKEVKMRFRSILSLATAGVMAAAMALCTACGVGQEKVKGDWTVDTVAGKAAAEYAAEYGQPELAVQVNFHIEEDKATVETPDSMENTAKKELKPEWRANGVELKDGDELVYALELDEDKNVLKYKASYSALGGGEEEVILKKGTYDFAAGIGEMTGLNEAGAETENNAEVEPEAAEAEAAE